MDRRLDAEYWVRENYFALADLLGPLYMDRVIARRGLVWSTEPSPGAKKSVEFLREHCVSSLLDVGCGYGRDAIFFAQQGFNVTGIEYSEMACEVARGLCRSKLAEAQKNPELDPAHHKIGRATIIHADFRSWEFLPFTFDAVFSFKTLHSLRHSPPDGAKDRTSAKAFVKRMSQCIRPGGLVAISTFSIDDHNYGKGRYIEDDTWDTRGHRPCAFYTKERFVGLFGGLELVHTDHLIIEEDHEPDGGHRHGMWFGVAVSPRS